MKLKICGISDIKTLEYLTDHPLSPAYIGFITNYPKSRRFVELNALKVLLKVDKKNSKYVAVLVKPDHKILEEIKSLPFDYYQLYDCSPEEVQSIKENYNKKIITALTIENKNDFENYQNYNDVTDIFLFDSKGYEKSMSFDHKLIENKKINKEIMLAGNIQIDDELENYKKIADIIDISGGLETSIKRHFQNRNLFKKN